MRVFRRRVPRDHPFRRTSTTRTGPAGRSSPPAPTTWTSRRCPTRGATPMRCCSGRWRGSSAASAATALEAGCVGAIAQGYVRAIDADGQRLRPRVGARRSGTSSASTSCSSPSTTWPTPTARARDSSPRSRCRAHPRLARAHPADAAGRPTRCRPCRGRRWTRRAPGTCSRRRSSCATRRRATRWRRPPSRACAASCAVEGVGTSTLGDRDEIGGAWRCASG